MRDSLRVLIIDDSAEDSFFIVQALSGGFQVLSERAANAASMQAALERGPWDLVISDYSIPGFGGLEALELYQQSGLDIPFIMVSGVMGEVLAVEMVKAGAHNYVLKDQLHRLLPAVRQELQAAEGRRSRKQHEEAAAYIASVVESCDDAIISATLNGRVVSWNTGAERVFGYTASEIVGRSGAVLVPEYRPEDWSEILERVGEGQHLESFESQWLRKDKKPVDILLSISPVKLRSGRVTGASIVAHDITNRKLDDDDRLTLIQELTAALAHVGEARDGNHSLGTSRTSCSR